MVVPLILDAGMRVYYHTGQMDSRHERFISQSSHISHPFGRYERWPLSEATLDFTLLDLTPKISTAVPQPVACEATFTHNKPKKTIELLYNYGKWYVLKPNTKPTDGSTNTLSPLQSKLLAQSLTFFSLKNRKFRIKCNFYHFTLQMRL